MQKLTLIGRLGRDAQKRVTQNNTSFITMTVAANSRFKGAEKTTWYDVMAFNVERYEKMLPYLTKGSSVVVVGEVDLSTEKSENGNVYLRASVVADSIDFNSGSSQSGNTASNETVVVAEQAQPKVVNMDDVPDEAMTTSSKKKTTKKAAEPVVTTVAEEPADGEEDLPF